MDGRKRRCFLLVGLHVQFGSGLVASSRGYNECNWKKDIGRCFDSFLFFFCFFFGLGFSGVSEVR